MLEEVDQFEYTGSTQIKDGTSIKEVEIRLAHAHHDKPSNTSSMGKQSCHFSPKDLTLENHLSCQYCSIDVGAGC